MLRLLRAGYLERSDVLERSELAFAARADHLHPVWRLAWESSDYSTRLSLVKRHVSQTVRHLLFGQSIGVPDKRRELALWQRRFGSIRSVMTKPLAHLRQLEGWVAFYYYRIAQTMKIESTVKIPPPSQSISGCGFFVGGFG